MLEHEPSQSIMIELLGQSLYEVWQALCSVIDEKYDMEQLWNTGGKNWTYEYKYRRVVLGSVKSESFFDLRRSLKLVHVF